MTELDIESLKKRYGGSMWDEHPDFPAVDWRYQVGEENTRLGYWEWVASELRWRQEENAMTDNQITSVQTGDAGGISIPPGPPKVYTPDPRGLVHKYNVYRANPDGSDGARVETPTFTLRPEDPHARAALLAYAESVRTENALLANDLTLLVERYALAPENWKNGDE